jgi:low temperature requirement protein LtrA
MTEDAPIKRANWLELFFDLVFVWAIAKTTHVIAHPHDGHVPLEAYGLFALILIPVWWAWTGHTLFTTRFDSEDVPHRVLSLAQMLAALFLAAFINPDFDATYYGFLASYLAIRLLIVAMYLRAARLDPAAAPAAHPLSAGFGLGLAVVAASLCFAPPARYVVLYLGIALEMATPIAIRRRLARHPVNPHHLPERLGLLTIILLGESVVALGTAMEHAPPSALPIATVFVGFAYLASAWWIYFCLTEERILGRELGHAQRLVYGHLPLYAGLAMSANFVRFALEPGLRVGDHAAMGAAGAALFVGALAWIHGAEVLRAPTRGALAFFLACGGGLVALSRAAG